MKIIIILSIFLCAKASIYAQEIKMDGVKGSFESIQSKVLEVTEISEDGFVFRGYTIEYKGKKIMVSAMVADGGYNVGDSINIMVNKSIIPNKDGEIRAFTFMVMPDMAKKMKEFQEKIEKDNAKGDINDGKKEF